MISLLFPYQIAQSVFEIDYNKLKQKGYKAVIFDIDNTLVHHGENSTPEIDDLFRQIQSTGLETLLLSNNSEERILRFCQNIDTKYIQDADKPQTRGYWKAIEMLGVEKSEVVVIGDQIFTDILGANRCKMANILVHYLRYPDEKKIGIRRNVEKVILWFYSHCGHYQNRLGEIIT